MALCIHTNLYGRVAWEGVATSRSGFMGDDSTRACQTIPPTAGGPCRRCRRDPRRWHFRIVKVSGKARSGSGCPVRGAGSARHYGATTSPSVRPMIYFIGGEVFSTARDGLRGDRFSSPRLLCFDRPGLKSRTTPHSIVSRLPINPRDRRPGHSRVRRTGPGGRRDPLQTPGATGKLSSRT